MSSLLVQADNLVKITDQRTAFIRQSVMSTVYLWVKTGWWWTRGSTWPFGSSWSEDNSSRVSNGSQPRNLSWTHNRSDTTHWAKHWWCPMILTPFQRSKANKQIRKIHSLSFDCSEPTKRIVQVHEKRTTFWPNMVQSDGWTVGGDFNCITLMNIWSFWNTWFNKHV